MARFSVQGFGRLLCLVLIVVASCCRSLSQAVSVQMREGFSHGYLVLRDSAGKAIASGEDIQNVNGNKIRSRLVFRFGDGSIDDEVTVAEQGQTFRLISDQHIQKGPSFPKALDVLIDTEAQRVDFVKDGTKEKKSEHMDMPVGLCNGIFFTIFRNLKISGPPVELPYLAVSSQQRLVKLAISSDGIDRYRVGGVSYKARRYIVKIRLGGISGAIAPAIGKDPGDFHIWMSTGAVPTVLMAHCSMAGRSGAYH